LKERLVLRSQPRKLGLLRLQLTAKRAGISFATFELLAKLVDLVRERPLVLPLGLEPAELPLALRVAALDLSQARVSLLERGFEGPLAREALILLRLDLTFEITHAVESSMKLGSGRVRALVETTPEILPAARPSSLAVEISDERVDPIRGERGLVAERLDELARLVELAAKTLADLARARRLARQLLRSLLRRRKLPRELGDALILGARSRRDVADRALDRSTERVVPGKADPYALDEIAHRPRELGIPTSAARSTGDPHDPSADERRGEHRAPREDASRDRVGPGGPEGGDERDRRERISDRAEPSLDASDGARPAALSLSVDGFDQDPRKHGPQAEEDVEEPVEEKAMRSTARDKKIGRSLPRD